MNHGINELYRNFAQALVEAAPENWASAWVTAVVHDDHAKTQYDYRSKGGTENWFDPGDDRHDKIAIALIRLRQAMKQPDLELWNNIIFRVEQSGKFNAEFRHDPKDDA
jgi:hypothetical protein